MTSGKFPYIPATVESRPFPMAMPHGFPQLMRLDHEVCHAVASVLLSATPHQNT
jgi:hypothetical protein